jgi:MtN3 and saliva related transmembrane protein
MTQFTPWIGMIAASLTTCSFLPQALKTWQTRSADDFSWLYLILFGTGIIMWDLYGLLRQDPALVTANTVTIGFLLVIIGIKASKAVK